MLGTPENLLEGISGAPEMKESHFLGKNVFWENAVGYLRNGQIYPPQLVIGSDQDEMWDGVPRYAVRYTPQWEHWVLKTGNFGTPENLLVGITGALGTKESHFLS